MVKAPNSQLDSHELRGLRRAGFACLGVISFWVILCIAPGTPLIEDTATGVARFNPFLQSLVAGFFVLFLAAGWAYGSASGSVKNHRDIVRMMSEAMGDLAYYLVLAFTAAHFVAILEGSNLPDSILLAFIILFGAIINLFLGSASAKWALLAPVLVPMLMLIGISPEMSTAAYRVGDGATNIITPLMPYFPLILVFCQRWQKEFGLGSLAATMLPYSMLLLGSGIILTIVWVVLGIPLGPNAPVQFTLQ
jgi:aminobenzoyl-glutamate transport protein